MVIYINAFGVADVWWKNFWDGPLNVNINSRWFICRNWSSTYSRQLLVFTRRPLSRHTCLYIWLQGISGLLPPARVQTVAWLHISFMNKNLLVGLRAWSPANSTSTYHSVTMDWDGSWRVRYEPEVLVSISCLSTCLTGFHCNQSGRSTNFARVHTEYARLGRFTSIRYKVQPMASQYASEQAS